MVHGKEWLKMRANEMAACPTTGEARAMCSLTEAGIECFTQVVFSTYILDFVIPSKLLVLEIDGATHDDTALYDSFRDAFCVAMGLQVLRIPNHLAHTAAEQVRRYPDKEGFVEKIETVFRCANGLKGRRQQKTSKKTKEQRNTDRLQRKAARQEAYQKKRERRRKQKLAK